jgi:hypothetical protein
MRRGYGSPCSRVSRGPTRQVLVSQRYALRKQRKGGKAKHNTRGPTPTFSGHRLIIDSAWKPAKYHCWEHASAVARLVLKWLLYERPDIKAGSCQLFRRNNQMTDRMIAIAIRESSGIRFCHNGYLHPVVPDWLPEAVRLVAGEPKPKLIKQKGVNL